MEKFIGREQELKWMQGILNSPKSEFVAVYGRRRVGKTLLIRAAAHDKFCFFITGLYERPKSEQLTNFAIAQQRYFHSENFTVRSNWPLAFYDLSRNIESLPKGKKIIFIDELPWMDTPKSGFVSALDNFWNGWAVLRDDIKLIVCGSATSWMLDNIIHETGGLHKRLTSGSLALLPLNLKEIRYFLKKKGFSYSNKQVAECYMVFGGIPYYLSLLDKGQSIAQNIDRLFFSQGAQLENEFNEIFQALYRKSGKHKQIMAVLSKKGIGMTRQELIEDTGFDNNGEFSKMLEEIEECGFIRSYIPFGKEIKDDDSRAKKDTLYQMTDPYSLFFYKFINENHYHDEHFWTSSYTSPTHNTWAGLAFEMLCLNHCREIKNALGIGGVQSVACSWRSQGKAQIDLLIDRKDDTVTICEIKYAKDDYSFSEEEEIKLRRRINCFLTETGTKKSVITTLITTYGLRQNAHSSNIQSVITLEDLFSI